MKSLKDVYVKMAAQDQAAATAAAAPAAELDEQTKLAYQQAMDYDTVGRMLAHQVFNDMLLKEAEEMPHGHGSGKKHEDGMPCLASCEHHGKGAEHEEKKASLQDAILAKMAADPAYVAELVRKHTTPQQ